MGVDIALVRQARKGCHLSFEAIFRTYEAPIGRFLLGMVRDQALAEDLCQETFASAYSGLSALLDESQLASWLYRIATNKAISALRRRRMVAWVPFDVQLHDRAGRSDLSDDVAVDDAAARSLARLPHDQVVCLLAHAEGLSYVELAHVLSCTLAAVKQRLYRARLAFRAAYAEETADQGGGRIGAAACAVSTAEP